MICSRLSCGLGMRKLLSGTLLVGLVGLVGLAAGAAPVMSQGISLPSLPSGLPGGLPQIPEMDSDFEDDSDLETLSPWSVHGFAEARAGMRLQNDNVQGSSTLSEVRTQLELDYAGSTVSGRVRTDLWLDVQGDVDSISLNRGEGPLDLREAWLQNSPASWLDIKVGRQILTWGVGDLVFINDLFPKDWQSFLLGRDTEYLKAPSDAMKLSFFTPAVNVDLIWTPEFDSDRYISGRYLSYFNPLVAGLSNDSRTPEVDFPAGDEVAMRVYKTIRSFEVALYGYDGYWKSPQGFDVRTGKLTFPELSVLGASLRGGLAGGVFSAELGRYISREDRKGDDPFVPNSQDRILVGYERELAQDFSGGVQYYAEIMSDYRQYKAALMEGVARADRTRHLLTTRLTRLTHSQTMTWSLFVFYSPSDDDWFARPQWSYKYTDQLQFSAGLNLLGGRRISTFFGQFEDNSSAYAGVRYSF